MPSIRPLLSCLVLLSVSSPLAVSAQVIPDATLGTENSRVRRAAVRGREADLIEGGATRGRNLFHSFQEFGVREGDAAYFANPAAIENIFGRITGGTPSNILGTLGVDGAANLFLMNPNGILFGPNSSLDLQGSFVGATANAIQFGEQGFFAANDVVAPGLLTVNPSAFLFNQIDAAPIQSIGNVFSAVPATLQVPTGQSIVLLGGDVFLNGTSIIAPGGRIEIGGIRGAGAVAIVSNGSELRLGFPGEVERTDVLITNGSRVLVAASGGGDIAINAHNISISQNSSLLAGILSNTGSIDVQAGDIDLDATGMVAASSGSSIINGIDRNGVGNSGDIVIDTDKLRILDGSQVGTLIFQDGQGSSGDVLVNANESVQVLSGNPFGMSTLGSAVASGGRGNAGDIIIQTPYLNIVNSQIVSNLFGDGSAGDVHIQAQRRVEIVSSGQGGATLPALLGTIVQQSGVGNAGNLTIDTSQLSVQNGAQILSSTFGIGNAKSLTVRASDLVEIDGGSATDTGLFAQVGGRVGEPARGNVGELTVETRQLTLRNGGQINATIFGSGSGGSLVIRAPIVQLVGTTTIPGRTGIQPSAIQTRIEPGGRGESADLIIETNRLSIEDGARIASDVEQTGQGRGGNVLIRARQSINITGDLENAVLPSQITAALNQGASGNAGNLNIETEDLVVHGGFILALVGPRSVGRGGDIRIETNHLSVQNGQIGASTNGQGNAGDLTISASDSILLAGEIPSINGSSALPSGLLARVRPTASGQGGTIRLRTGRLNIQDGSQIQVSTQGNGDAGNLFIRANEINLLDTDSPNILPTGIFAGVQVEPNSNVLPTGNGGNVDIQVNSLNLNQGQISSSTAGRGNAGNITIRDADTVNLSNSTITSTVNNGATGSGGDVTLDANLVKLKQGSITASTNGNGRAGNVAISNAEQVSLNRSNISTAVGDTGVGQGGSIDIQTGNLALQNGSNITSSTANQGNTGSIAITATDGINLRSNSTISNRVETGATGGSQTITFNTPSLTLRGNSAISAATDGNGRAGDIRIGNGNRSADTVSLSNSRISTQVQLNAIVPVEEATRAQAHANSSQGNITIDARRLNLDSSAITASTNGRGTAGNVIVNNAGQISLNNDSSISSAVGHNGQRRGGNVVLHTDSLGLNNSSINTSTNGSARAGNISLNADNLEAVNGGRLSSSSNRGRRAGTITLRELDNIRLSGSNSNGRSSGIFANTQRGGRGGVINLETQILDLNDGATISTTSRGSGRAGSIAINAAKRLQSEGGSISTSANQSRGGDIRITGGDLDLSEGSSISTDVEQGAGNGGNITVNADAAELRDNSDVQTRVGPDGTGNGGNITVNADSVIAFDDSDIITESPNRGGDINLNTPAFFGSGYQSGSNPDNANGNGRVDLDASGTVSSGEVQTPDTSFIQNSLADLPSENLDAEQLIAKSCIARRADGSTFLVTGRGSLPQRPGAEQPSEYPTGEVRAIPQGESRQHEGDPIVEPQGVYRLTDGRLVMSRECQPAP